MSDQIKKSVSPRDVFLHILTIVTLYMSAGSFIALLFQYINKLIPDLLTQGAVSLGALRFAISSLLIVFPVFIGISWLLNKGYIQDIAKRESKIRKWLIYFTLFATALIVIGDLVKILYEFLGGGITLRFILKALSFILVAGTIFGYYLWDVRKKEPLKSPKFFVRMLCGTVAVAAIGGFFLIGSPKEARLLRFDEQRVMDLQNIQWQVVNFWQSKGRLPESLANLQDPIAGFSASVDPETKDSYEYQMKAETIFELCAVFSRPSSARDQQQILKAVSYFPAPFSQDQNWAHEAGRACFERTIDKELYPVRPQKY